MQPGHPVRGDAAIGAGDGLIMRVRVGWGQFCASDYLLGPVVPEPRLAGFEALDDLVSGVAPVLLGVLGR